MLRGWSCQASPSPSLLSFTSSLLRCAVFFPATVAAAVVDFHQRPLTTTTTSLTPPERTHPVRQQYQRLIIRIASKLYVVFSVKVRHAKTRVDRAGKRLLLELKGKLEGNRDDGSLRRLEEGTKDASMNI